MRLTSAMLADAAHVQGGKLYILGGGFESIRSRTVPAVHRSLTVAMILEVPPQERNRDLELSIALIDEDGQTMAPQATARLRVGAGPQLPPGAPTVVPLVAPFYNVKFPEAKGYAFVISHEGTDLGRLSFRVVLEPAP